MLVQKLKIGLAGGAWRALRLATRMDRAVAGDDESGQGRIFACLHRDILPALLYVEALKPTLLVSHSPDGDILRRALGRWGYGFVRGSTGKDGRRAFEGLLRVLRRGGCVGLAVDGPRGPFGQVRAGVIQLARLSGLPIVPLTVDARRAINLRTWDRTLVPLPGSRVDVHEGSPLFVPPRLDGEVVDRWREVLARRLADPLADAGRPEAAFE